MTESELTNALKTGKAIVENPDTSTEDPHTPSAPHQEPSSKDQFIPLLTTLSSMKPVVTTPPSFVPRSFDEQFQFVLDGSNAYLYLYFNKIWNKVPTLALVNTFWGNGADDALNISIGETVIDLGGASVFIKNYTSISITGTAYITFTNPHANGTLIVFRSQGDVTITSTHDPVIDLANLGGEGGTGHYGNASIGVPGDAGKAFGAWGYMGTITAGSGGGTISYTGGGGSGASLVSSGNAGGDQSGHSGTGGAAGSTFSYPPTATAASLMIWPCAPASGGGAGGNISLNNTVKAGDGGRGAGGFLCLCGGALNISSAFSAVGANGGSTANGGCSGGGAGAGGSFVFLYNTLTANTATYTLTGGTHGTGASGAANGADAPDGTFIVAQNVVF